MEEKPLYYYGTGRRKTAIAQVRLYPGSGKITINSKPFERTYGTENFRRIALMPLEVTGCLDKFDGRGTG